MALTSARLECRVTVGESPRERTRQRFSADRPPLRVLVITVVHDPDDARIRYRQLSALLRMGAKVTYAAPFSAYRTLSLLGLRYLPVHQAVRTILGQVALDSEILRRISERAAGEGILLDGDVVGRAEFVCLRD